MSVCRAANLVRYIPSKRMLGSIQRCSTAKCSVIPVRFASNTDALPQSDALQVTFAKPNGDKLRATCKEGQSLLDAVVDNELDLPGYGACEGTLTCSTCHVILSQADYDKVPNKPLDDENDMLDLAYELTNTSRLGCQVVMTKELNGLEVKLPSGVNDARS